MELKTGLIFENKTLTVLLDQIKNVINKNQKLTGFVWNYKYYDISDFSSILHQYHDLILDGRSIAFVYKSDKKLKISDFVEAERLELINLQIYVQQYEDISDEFITMYVCEISPIIHVNVYDRKSFIAIRYAKGTYQKDWKLIPDVQMELNDQTNENEVLRGVLNHYFKASK